MELDGSGVFAHFLDVLLDGDEFAVDVVTELFEGFGNLDSVHRAKDCAGGRGLCADCEGYAFESGSSGFGGNSRGGRR